MRTTLTLDPDVTALLKREMRRTEQGLKATVNQALRRALGPAAGPGLPPFRVKPHSFGLRPGFDPDRMNQLAGELEDEEISRKLAREQ